MRKYRETICFNSLFVLLQAKNLYLFAFAATKQDASILAVRVVCAVHSLVLFVCLHRMLDLVSIALRCVATSYILFLTIAMFHTQIAKFVKDTEKGHDMIVKMNRKLCMAEIVFKTIY